MLMKEYLSLKKGRVFEGNIILVIKSFLMKINRKWLVKYAKYLLCKS